MNKFRMFDQRIPHSQRIRYKSGKTVIGTYKGISATEWERICGKYNFSWEERRKCGGSISGFISEFL
jgi:hypothetical protein